MNEFSDKMPKKGGRRKGVLSRKTNNSKKCKAARLCEDAESNEQRLKSKKVYQAEKRKNETPEETEDRRAYARERDAYK